MYCDSYTYGLQPSPEWRLWLFVKKKSLVAHAVMCLLYTVKNMKTPLRVVCTDVV